MKAILHVSLVSLFLLFSGCATKQPIHTSTPYLITLKTPQMAFSDTGFINQGDAYTQLQIFSAGALLLNLEMAQSICLDGTCLDKSDFNQRFFGTKHYETMMSDIVHQRAIYEGKNRVEIENGFVQEIDLSDVKIHYRVEKGNVTFKESVYGILIRLKPLQ